MKEYRVMKPKLGWSKTTEKLGELLNTYAKQGWPLKAITPHEPLIAFTISERNKNRQCITIDLA